MATGSEGLATNAPPSLILLGALGVLFTACGYFGLPKYQAALLRLYRGPKALTV